MSTRTDIIRPQVSPAQSKAGLDLHISGVLALETVKAMGRGEAVSADDFKHAVQDKPLPLVETEIASGKPDTAWAIFKEVIAHAKKENLFTEKTEANGKQYDRAEVAVAIEGKVYHATIDRAVDDPNAFRVQVGNIEIDELNIDGKKVLQAQVKPENDLLKEPITVVVNPTTEEISLDLTRGMTREFKQEHFGDPNYNGKISETGFTPQEHQLKAVIEVAKALGEGRTNNLVTAGTGTGKTAILAFRAKAAGQGVFIMPEELVAEMKRELPKFLGEQTVQLDAETLADPERLQKFLKDNKFKLVSQEQAYQIEKVLGKKFAGHTIVGDEAHQLNPEFVERVMKSNDVLAVTATPTKALLDKFGGKVTADVSLYDAQHKQKTVRKVVARDGTIGTAGADTAENTQAFVREALVQTLGRDTYLTPADDGYISPEKIREQHPDYSAEQAVEEALKHNRVRETQVQGMVFADDPALAAEIHKALDAVHNGNYDLAKTQKLEADIAQERRTAEIEALQAEETRLNETIEKDKRNGAPAEVIEARREALAATTKSLETLRQADVPEVHLSAELGTGQRTLIANNINMDVVEAMRGVNAEGLPKAETKKMLKGLQTKDRAQANASLGDFLLDKKENKLTVVSRETALAYVDAQAKAAPELAAYYDKVREGVNKAYTAAETAGADGKSAAKGIAASFAQPEQIDPKALGATGVVHVAKTDSPEVIASNTRRLNKTATHMSSDGPLGTGFSNPNILAVSSIITQEPGVGRAATTMQELGRPIRAAFGKAFVFLGKKSGLSDTITAAQTFAPDATGHYIGHIGAESFASNATSSAEKLGVSSEAAAKGTAISLKAGNQATRNYHTVEHFKNLEDGSASIGGALKERGISAPVAEMMANAYSVAARDHDVVYITADGKLLPEVEKTIGKYLKTDDAGNFVKGENGGFIIDPAKAHGENIDIALKTFGYEAGKPLNPFVGQNEFLSALHSLEINEGISKPAKVAITGMIQSTIPFDKADSVDQLADRVAAQGLTPDEVRATGMSAADLANRNVANFGAKDPKAFMENTLKLMREGGVDFTNPESVAKKAAATAGFFEKGLAEKIKDGKAAIFRGYDGFPPAVKVEELNNAALAQIERSIVELRVIADVANEAAARGETLKDGLGGPEIMKRAAERLPRVAATNGERPAAARAANAADEVTAKPVAAQENGDTKKPGAANEVSEPRKISSPVFDPEVAAAEAAIIDTDKLGKLQRILEEHASPSNHAAQVPPEKTAGSTAAGNHPAVTIEGKPAPLPDTNFFRRAARRVKAAFGSQGLDGRTYNNPRNAGGAAPIDIPIGIQTEFGSNMPQQGPLDQVRTPAPAEPAAVPKDTPAAPLAAVDIQKQVFTLAQAPETTNQDVNNFIKKNVAGLSPQQASNYVATLESAVTPIYNDSKSGKNLVDERIKAVYEALEARSKGVPLPLMNETPTVKPAAPARQPGEGPQSIQRPDLAGEIPRPHINVAGNAPENSARGAAAEPLRPANPVTETIDGIKISNLLREQGLDGVKGFINGLSPKQAAAAQQNLEGFFAANAADPKIDAIESALDARAKVKETAPSQPERPLASSEPSARVAPDPNRLVGGGVVGRGNGRTGRLAPAPGRNPGAPVSLEELGGGLPGGGGDNMRRNQPLLNPATRPPVDSATPIPGSAAPAVAEPNLSPASARATDTPAPNPVDTVRAAVPIAAPQQSGLVKFLTGDQKSGYSKTSNVLGIKGGFEMLLTKNENIPDSIRIFAGSTSLASGATGLRADVVRDRATQQAATFARAGNAAAAEGAERLAQKAQNLAGTAGLVSIVTMLPIDAYEAYKAFEKGDYLGGGQKTSSVVSGSLMGTALTAGKVAEYASKTAETLKTATAVEAAAGASEAIAALGKISAVSKTIAAVTGPAGTIVAIGAISLDTGLKAYEIVQVSAETEEIYKGIRDTQNKNFQAGVSQEYVKYAKDNQETRAYNLPQPKVTEYKNLDYALGYLKNTLHVDEISRENGSTSPDVALKHLDKAIENLAQQKRKLAERFSDVRPILSASMGGQASKGLSDRELAMTIEGRLALEATKGSNAVADITRVDNDLRMLQAAKRELTGDANGMIKVNDQVAIPSYKARIDDIAHAKAKHEEINKELAPKIPGMKAAVEVIEGKIAQYKQQIETLRERYTQLGGKTIDQPDYIVAREATEKLEREFAKDPKDIFVESQLLVARAKLVPAELNNLVQANQDITKGIAAQVKLNQTLASDPTMLKLQQAIKTPVNDSELAEKQAAATRITAEYLQMNEEFKKSKKAFSEKFATEEQRKNPAYMDAAKALQMQENAALIKFVDGVNAERKVITKQREILLEAYPQLDRATKGYASETAKNKDIQELSNLLGGTAEDKKLATSMINTAAADADKNRKANAVREGNFELRRGSKGIEAVALEDTPRSLPGTPVRGADGTWVLDMGISSQPSKPEPGSEQAAAALKEKVKDYAIKLEAAGLLPAKGGKSRVEDFVKRVMSKTEKLGTQDLLKAATDVDEKIATTTKLSADLEKAAKKKLDTAIFAKQDAPKAMDNWNKALEALQKEIGSLNLAGVSGGLDMKEFVVAQTTPGSSGKSPAVAKS